MVYAGKGSYIYWGSEGTVGAGDPSSDQNIPFNPIASLAPPKPKYVDAEYRTFDSLPPKYVATEELAPGEGPFESLFFDPFLLLSFFTHKTVGGTWGTGNGTIAADFTDVDDIDTIFAQYHIQDQASTNHIDRLLKYGLPMKYSLKAEKAKLLKESATFKFLDFEDNTQAMACANTFHDQAWGSAVGGWANWDNSGLGSTGKRSPINSALTKGAAALTGLQIETVDITFDMPYDTSQTFDSLVHSIATRGIQNFMVKLTGKTYDKTIIAELEAAYDSRTKDTFKFTYDTTASYLKYLQFTNSYFSPESDITPIPEAGKPAEASIVIKGGASTALSFAGTWLNRADPTALITTSP